MKKIFPFLLTLLILASCGNDDDNNPNHCNNGIQDGNETGVDCGGSCDPCNIPQDGLKRLSFTIDGESFDYTSTGWNSNTGLSSGYVYTTGEIVNIFQELFLTVEFKFNDRTLINQLVLNEYIGISLPFGQFGNDIDYAFFEAELPNGKKYESDNAGNTVSNSSLTITEVSVEPIPWINELYRVKGVFNCKVKEVYSGDIVDLTNGSFELIFSYYSF